MPPGAGREGKSVSLSSLKRDGVLGVLAALSRVGYGFLIGSQGIVSSKSSLPPKDVAFSGPNITVSLSDGVSFDVPSASGPLEMDASTSRRKFSPSPIARSVSILSSRTAIRLSRIEQFGQALLPAWQGLGRGERGAMVLSRGLPVSRRLAVLC